MDEWAARVLELETEGLTTSDAQGVADVELGLVWTRSMGDGEKGA